MIYELIGSQLFVDKKLVSPSIESKLFSLYIIGDFMGSIVHMKPLYADDSLHLIKENLNKGLGFSFLKDFFSNIVGPCVFIYIENNRETFIFSSFSSSGLFFSTIHSKIQFTQDESDFLELIKGSSFNIIEDELLSNMTLHSIFCRSPFITFIKEIQRVPSASYVSFDNARNLVRNRGLLFKKQKLSNLNRHVDFQVLLESILLIKYKFFKGKIFLFFSGGIDSSLLLANLKKITKDFLAIFIPYHGTRSRASYTAKFVSKVLGVKLRISKMNIHDVDFLKKTAKSGFGAVPGMQYIGAGNRLDYLELGKDSLNVLTGQNADTLIHIDTFAPASTVIGYKRFFANLEARQRRYFFSSKYLDNLKDFNNFEELLKHISSGLEEHSVYKLPKEDMLEIQHKIRNHKLIHTFTPIMEIFQRDFIKIDDFKNLQPNEKIFLLKIMRWFRTIQNVPLNYRNMSKESNINRILPYTEGPIANFAINYEILDDDHRSEKKIIYKNFSQLSKFNYRFLVYLAFIVSLPKLIIDKFKFIFLRKKLVSDNYQQHNISLSLLTENNESIIKIFKDDKVRNYLKKLQSYIDENKIGQITVKKQDEVVRYAGAVYFLSNLLNNEPR